MEQRTINENWSTGSKSTNCRIKQNYRSCDRSFLLSCVHKLTLLTIQTFICIGLALYYFLYYILMVHCTVCFFRRRHSHILLLELNLTWALHDSSAPATLLLVSVSNSEDAHHAMSETSKESFVDSVQSGYVQSTEELCDSSEYSISFWLKIT